MLHKKSSTPATEVLTYKKSSLMARILKYKYFYLMFIPVLIMNIIFNYIPMAGIRYAFYKYNPYGPPKFIGWKNFQNLIHNAKFINAFNNTLYLSLVNLLLATFIGVLFAMLMNEIKNKFFKSFTQTILYMPHFISWVVTASIFYLILSPDNGLINNILGLFGIKPIYFMVQEKWWTPIFLYVSRWKDTGWSTVIYLAALSAINTELYEAAAMDGAGKFKQALYVTLPAITNTILVVFILNLAKVLNLFEPVFVMTNPMVTQISEVIKTYTYNVGLQQADYGYSTAVGLFQSIVSLILVLISNGLSKKIKGEGIL